MSKTIHGDGHSLGTWSIVLLAWVVSLASILGSLFFSEMLKLPPCSMCWYQRIAMYPLGATLALGFIYRDPSFLRYSSPLVLMGLVAAGYHNLLYYQILPHGISPCSGGVSCTEAQLEWFGFITIPLLSLSAFIGISILLWIFKKQIGADIEKE